MGAPVGAMAAAGIMYNKRLREIRSKSSTSYCDWDCDFLKYDPLVKRIYSGYYVYILKPSDKTDFKLLRKQIKYNNIVSNVKMILVMMLIFSPMLILYFIS